LGEIEAVLHAHPAVAQAVVVVHGSGPDASLVGYLAPDRVDLADVERHCRRQLPDHLVPARWVRLPTLPTTASGKVDRHALPPHRGRRRRRTTTHPPRTWRSSSPKPGARCWAWPTWGAAATSSPWAATR